MLTNMSKAQAALAALDLITEAAKINAELVRRRDAVIPEEVEFEGEAFLKLDGIYQGKASIGDGPVEGLMIEGIAAAWTQDREDDVFDKGAFDRALIKANSRGLPVMYNHSQPLWNDIYGRGAGSKLQLGVVKEFWKDPREGLKMRAFIPRPAEGHPILEDIYQKIARGEMKGLSVGGKMRQMLGKIVDTDLAEVSVSPNQINGDAMIYNVTRQEAVG